MALAEFVDQLFEGKHVPKSLPFAHEFSPRKDYAAIERLKMYKTFIDDLTPPLLDVGEPNFVKSELETFLHLGIESTLESNFNIEVRSLNHGYSTIFCFEVLEHVMNPATFMGNLWETLVKEGVVYLSTPRLGMFGAFQSNMHFAEYKRRQLEILFSYVGFRVEKYELVNPFSWWFTFTGFRPPVRMCTQRVHLFKLRK